MGSRMTRTIGSLFSGIGGLELGLEWAGWGPTVWQVEQSEFCRGVLARHWPNAKRYTDVREVGAANLAPVDVICGGFPCQDVSAAGKGAGLAGARSGLWSEFKRIIAELSPRWVVVENVASGADRWADAVSDALEGLGLAVLPVPITAADVGAPHKRSRVFLVAHSVREGLQVPQVRPEHGGPPARESQWGSPARGGVEALREARRRGVQPFVPRVADGIPHRVDRVRALGNAVVPQCAEVIGEVMNLIAAHPTDAPEGGGE